MVPVKNMIRALGPRLNTAFKSMLRVIRTNAAGKRYLLATKYKFEVSSDIIPKELNREGSR